MSGEPPSPVDVALDLLLYVPVGLAVTVGEEVPKLAAKGRSRLAAARMIGQFAVAQGRREVDRRLNGPRPTPGRRPGSATPSPSAAPSTVGDPFAPAAGDRPVTDPGAHAAPSGPAGGAPAVVADPAAPVAPSAPAAAARPAAPASAGAARTPTASSPRRTSSRPPSGAARRRPAAGGPDADALAIPLYDSLSASQVVSRLDGLSPAELDAVRGYEADHRGRRTILARVTQLQSGR